MIDSHQHFWNYNEERHTWITPEMSILRNDYYPNYSEPLFRKQGFTGCVAVQADSSEEETLFLVA
jgi:L-fuconolactonase